MMARGRMFEGHLPVTLSEVDLAKILNTGQVFRWTQHEDSWYGVIRDKAWVLRQDPAGIHYSVYPITGTSLSLNVETELTDYFNLKHKLSEITRAWLVTDAHLSGLVTSHPGLRLIRQDPYECLLAFITSACNNIPRITSLIYKLSSLSEQCVAVGGRQLYALPDLALLASPGMEHTLRALGFGYRAKYIVSAASQVLEKGGLPWLDSLKDVGLSEARAELSVLAGVGPKVASCVCLMSLDKHEAVPIDTHIHQVAVKHYSRPNKALTPALHHQIEAFFQQQHGLYAGWAQAYLFYSSSNKNTKPSVTPGKGLPSVTPDTGIGLPLTEKPPSHAIRRSKRAKIT